MSLQDVLKIKLSNSSLTDVAQLMGYHYKKVNKAAARIESVLSDNSLGLNSGQFDFKYSDVQFLDALCRILNINTDDYKEDIDAINSLYADKRDRYKSYIFIDTGFKRSTQPIVMLAMLQSRRFIKLDYVVLIKPLHEQIEHVKTLVKQHYKESDGRLDMWGEIRRYVFIYGEDEKLGLSPDGIIIDEPVHVEIPIATVTVGGKDISKIIKVINDDDC